MRPPMKAHTFRSTIDSSHKQAIRLCGVSNDLKEIVKLIDACNLNAATIQQIPQTNFTVA